MLCDFGPGVVRLCEEMLMPMPSASRVVGQGPSGSDVSGLDCACSQVEEGQQWQSHAALTEAGGRDLQANQLRAAG